MKILGILDSIMKMLCIAFGGSIAMTLGFRMKSEPFSKAEKRALKIRIAIAFAFLVAYIIFHLAIELRLRK